MNKHASELSKLRWKKVSKEDRSEYSRNMNKIRWSKDKEVIHTTSVASIRKDDIVEG